MVDSVLEPATRDFNFQELQAEDVVGDELEYALRTPPMMAGHRAILVRDAERLGNKARAVLQKAVAAPASDIVLVITATIPRGSRAAFYRHLKSKCRTLEWKTPRPSEIPGWIRERARHRWRMELSPASAQWIAGAVGADLSRIEAELEKLSTLSPDERDEASISALVPRTRRIDRWAWLDLVAAREYVRALRELDDVLTTERGIGLVAGLLEHHLLIGLALETGQRGLGAFMSETGRGYLSWKARIYARQAKAWTVTEIDRALRALHRADRHLKSGVRDKAAMTELLLSLGAIGKTA